MQNGFLKDNIFETIIGFLVIILCASIVIFFGPEYRKNHKNTLTLLARFSNVDGVYTGSEVKISGVKIGSVKSQKLDHKDFSAILQLELPQGIKIRADSTAAVKTGSLVTGKYIDIAIGSESEFLNNNNEIQFTRSTMDIEGLIEKVLANFAKK